MIRRAFTLRLKPGALAEYKERHEQVWPELVAEIERCGIATMTAFNEGDTIFYYSEIRDPEAWEKLWGSEVHDRWGEAFKPLIDFDDSGMISAGGLTEIFHLETGA